MIRLPAAAALAVLLAAPALAAQGPRLAAGDEVRFTLLPDRRAEPRARELRGTVASSTADTVVVQLHSQLAPVSVPVAWIGELQVSRGPASAWHGAREGARTGTMIGVAVGSIVGAEVAASTDEDFFRAVLTRAAFYGFSLGATSALQRAIRPGIRWERVPLRGGGEGSARRLGLGVQVPF